MTQETNDTHPAKTLRNPNVTTAKKERPQMPKSPYYAKRPKNPDM